MGLNSVDYADSLFYRLVWLQMFAWCTCLVGVCVVLVVMIVGFACCGGCCLPIRSGVVV